MNMNPEKNQQNNKYLCRIILKALNGKADPKYKTDAYCMAAVGTIHVADGG